jgi:hypothetical protein
MVNVALINDGRSASEIDLPREAFVALSGRDARGRVLNCANNSPAGPAQPTRVRAGQTTGLTLDVARRCVLTGPGEYAIAFRYQSPARAGLLPVEGSGTVQLVVAANAPPPPAGQPRISVSVTPRVDSAPGRPLPVQLFVRNEGNAPVSIDAPREAFVQIDLRDPNGRKLTCTPSRKAGPAQPRQLLPGQQASVMLDLSRLCRLPSTPGAYRAEIRYDSRARRALLAVNGSGATELFLGATPRPPPPPPASGHVTVAFPDRLDVSRRGPVQISVRVTNDGRAPVALSSPNAGFVSVVEATNGKNRPVDCRPLPEPSTPALTLFPGQSRTVAVDLGKLCRFDKKGEYQVRLRYQSPRPSPNAEPISAQSTLKLRIEK